MPCSRSSRRVAVSAAWSLSDHSGSVLVRPPHLIRSQAKVTRRCPEGLAAVDRVEELRSYLGWGAASSLWLCQPLFVCHCAPDDRGRSVTPGAPTRVCPCCALLIAGRPGMESCRSGFIYSLSVAMKKSPLVAR